MPSSSLWSIPASPEAPSAVFSLTSTTLVSSWKAQTQNQTVAVYGWLLFLKTVEATLGNSLSNGGLSKAERPRWPPSYANRLIKRPTSKRPRALAGQWATYNWAVTKKRKIPCLRTPSFGPITISPSAPTASFKRVCPLLSCPLLPCGVFDTLLSP